MTEFKQIIGRGTRLPNGHDKMFFNILDYAGSASEKFADPDFDGTPAEATQEEIDEYGHTIVTTPVAVPPEPEEDDEPNGPGGWVINEPPPPGEPRKLYTHGGPGGIDTEITLDIDAEKLRKGKPDFFDQYGPDARTVLNAILDKYAEHGVGEFSLPNVLEVPPVSSFGTLADIAKKFGGTDKLLAAVDLLQEYLYAA